MENDLSGRSQSAAKGAWKGRQGVGFCLTNGIIKIAFGDAVVTSGKDGGSTVASQPC